MRVLLLSDRSFTRREHAMLRRLEVGLLDEGVEIVRALPEGCPDYASAGIRGACRYGTGGFLRRSSVAGRRLFGALRELPLGSKTGRVVDIVHAWGDGCWSVAADLAERSGADLVLGVSDGASLRRVQPMERALSRIDGAETRGLWTAPDDLMLESVKARATLWGVREVAWGVHVTESLAPRRTDDDPRSLCVLAPPGAASQVATLLDGLALLAGTRPDLLVFLDAPCMDGRRDMWRRARSLGLTDPPSAISRVEEHRELVLQTDALLLPGESGTHRSLTLEALGAGVPVVTAPDPLVRCLSPETAFVLDEVSPRGWCETLSTVLDAGDEVERRRHAARDWVRDHHLAHAQVQATLEAYRALEGAAPLEFRGSGR